MKKNANENFKKAKEIFRCVFVVVVIGLISPGFSNCNNIK